MARFTVTNNNNSGAGSLRQAIIDAGNVVGVDIIDLTSVSGTINLNSSLGNLNTGNDINFVDDGNTTISGQNASGQNAYQILAVNGASVTFSRLTFANGLARGGDGNNGGGGGLGAGGALFINAGNVTLNNVTFSGNRAVGGNANGNAGSGGSTGSNGSHGGNGGGLNSTTGGLGGSGGTRSGNNGNPGAEGGAGGFGAGGGGGGGGGGATSGNFFNDPDDGGGNGGNGGNAGFGGGGGGGGGGGNDYDFHSGNEHGRGGNRGTGGHSDGGNGSDGAGGDNRTGGRGGGGAGLGGAIFVNSGASLTLLNSVFTGNSVTGGTGANNGQADGANIFVNGGTVQSIGTTATIARDYTNVKYTNNGTINAVSFPTNPYEYNRSIYRLTTAGTWQQAQAQAQSLGGNLVTVNNQAEQDWLVTTFGSDWQWIGLTDEVTEGQFRWASGETSTYTNWFPGEPNNAWNEDYVHMYSNAYGNGKWNDSGSTASFRGIIENKFFEYNGSRYLLTGSGTWKQAQDQAQSLGGNLVTVNNQAEQDWLVSTFGGSEQLWIGLTDEVTEGQFRWASGETSTFTNWLPGEPNNVGNEDYVGMNFDGAGKWNDYSSTSSQRGIIEINQYGATGRNADSQFFVLAKPEPFTISVIGGFGPDIFQLRSYDGLTTSQQVSGGQGSDVFNISLEGSSGTVGLNFNTGKLKDLAELLVTPDWDVREKRRAADISAATIHAGIDYAAAALQAADITGLADGAIDAIATTAHLAIDLANIQINYNLDIEEYQNNLKGIGDFFSGQGANGWGTVNVTQRRSIVEIMDFQPGIDTITLPKLTGNQAYRYTLVSGINGTGVEVAYNNQTNEPSTFLRIYIDPTLLPIVQGQNVGVTQFIESLFTNNATNAVIGTTRNNTSKVAVSGASYTGTMAGDYIYVAQNNPTVGSVKIYGLAGDDLLAGRKNGTNEIYGGDGDDFIVPGGVNDTIDGGAGYDQVNYSQ
ncbi:lectin-like protein, partial [Dolichospermum planctonicum UHCC 0167]|uniref:C-type lectin domain-containing protein n=1 Tax=Dolichospermum planctonicum TaxID=136072 RepID=UPI002246F550